MGRFLDKIHPRKDTKMSAAVETVEYVGASYGYGYLMGRYREKAELGGMPADLLVGGALRVAGLLGEHWRGAPRFLKSAAPHATVLGLAGLGAFAHMKGVGAGSRASGALRASLPPGTSPSDLEKIKKLVPGTVFSGIPPARGPHNFLSSRELARMVAA